MKKVSMPSSTLFTDSLESRYWLIAAQVLSHNEENDDNPFYLREVDLIDIEWEKVSRTRAITFLHPQECNRWQNPDIALIEEAIKNGGSMGKVFRNDYGYEVRRNVIDVFQIDLPHYLREVFQVLDDKARVKVSEFHARKEDQHIFYGTLIEIISPDYRPISMPIESLHNWPFHPFIATWLLSGASLDDLRKYLDEKTQPDFVNPEPMAEIYRHAMAMNQQPKLSLRNRIEDYVHKKWMFAQ